MRKIIICIMIIFLFMLSGCTINNDNDDNKDKTEDELIKINKVTFVFDSSDLNKNISVKEEGLDIKIDELEEDSDEIGSFKSFEITISKKDGFEIASDVVIEWEKTENEEATIASKKINKEEIKVIIKKYQEKGNDEPVFTYIDEINYKFISNNKEIEVNNDNIKYELIDEINTDKDNSVIICEYKLTLTPNDNYKFSDVVTLNWEKDNSEECVIKEKSESSDKIIIIFRKEIHLLFKVEISLDTLNYTVSSNSEYYSAEIVKPLDYLVIVTKVTMELSPSDDFVFIVNEKEISKDKYKIDVVDNKFVLTYKIDDPNWTPYY